MFINPLLKNTCVTCFNQERRISAARAALSRGNGLVTWSDIVCEVTMSLNFEPHLHGAEASFSCSENTTQQTEIIQAWADASIFSESWRGGVHREDAIFLLSPVSSLKRKTLLSVIQTLKRIISIQRDDPSFSALPVMGLICCSAPCVVGLFYPKTNEQHFSCFRARRHYSRFHQHSCSGNIQARWFQGLSR